MIKQALINLEELQRYNETIKTMDASVLDGIVSYSDSTLQSNLQNLVDQFIDVKRLHLDESEDSKDKFKSLYGFDRGLKHKDEITCILCLKNGLIASGNLDSNIRIWDPSTGKCKKILDGHTHAVLCIIELQDGSLISGSLDHTIIAWDPMKGKILNTIEGFSHPVIGMFELDSQSIAMNLNQPSITIWNWRSSSKQNTQTIPVMKSPLTCMQKKNSSNMLVG